MWRLIGIQGVYKGHFFDLAGDQLRVGRDEECEIGLPQDEYVAGIQAELALCNGAYVYQDLNASCPTLVNGTTLQGMSPLKPGDSVQIGDSVFRMEQYGDRSQESTVATNSQAPIGRPNHQSTPNRTQYGWFIIVPIGAFFWFISQLSPKTVTLDQYNRIQSGMSHSEVISIVGKDGQEISHASNPLGKYEGYCWKNSDGSNMVIQFTNDHVEVKAQAGL